MLHVQGMFQTLEVWRKQMVSGWFSFVDVVFFGVALLLAVGGYQRGFAGQVAHVVTFLVMGFLLFFTYPPAFGYLEQHFFNVDAAYLMWALFFGLLLLAVGCFSMVGRLLAKVLKVRVSSRSDHVYGFALGFARGALMALLGMVFLVILGPPEFRECFRAKSPVGKLVCNEMVPHIQPRIPHARLEGIERVKSALLYQEEAGVF